MRSDTVVYFKNGIGNFIEMTPAIRALCTLDPSGKVDICTDSDWSDSRIDALRDVWERSELVDKVIEFPAQRLDRQYKRWFYSKHTEGSDGLQVFISRAPMFGNRIDWSRSLTHEADYYMALVRSMGYTGPTPRQHMPTTPVPPVVFDPHNHDTIITLCNGASGSQKQQKQWPHFAKLAKVIKYFYPEATVVKVGNGKELRGVPCDIDLVGKLTFTQTTYVLKYSDLMITSDTGLMHAGDALCTSMIVLFGGTVLSKNSPLNGTATIVRSDLECQPCQYTDRFLTCEHMRCLHDLTVGQVFAHVRRKIERLA